VLEPIPYESFAGCSVEELTERVRSRIAAHIGEKELTPAEGC
jgi:hypothetical protein